MESHAYTSRAAAKRLGIITVDVLPIANGVGSILVARVHCHWSVGSTRAHSRQRLMLQPQICWNARGMCSVEHWYVPYSLW